MQRQSWEAKLAAGGWQLAESKGLGEEQELAAGEGLAGSWQLAAGSELEIAGGWQLAALESIVFVEPAGSESNFEFRMSNFEYRMPKARAVNSLSC
jgi:hypothetical protein